MKRKEIKFTANLHDDSGQELLRQDIEKIQELTPGFQPPMLIVPLDPIVQKPLAPVEGKTFLQMPIKKEKKE